MRIGRSNWLDGWFVCGLPNPFGYKIFLFSVDWHMPDLDLWVGHEWVHTDWIFVLEVWIGPLWLRFEGDKGLFYNC